jgi:hypothetical protein
VSRFGGRERQCDGKRRYRSKGDAKLALRRIPSSSMKSTRDSFGVYRCHYCDGFHIGSKPPLPPLPYEGEAA